MIVIIDTNTLDLLCNPNKKNESIQCESWFYDLYRKGVLLCTSVLCDYEIRRGLLAAESFKGESPGLPLLDKLRTDGYLQFLTVTEEVLDVAAILWAEAAVRGQSNKDVKNIDVDVIICGHYFSLRNQNPGRRIVIATKNTQDFTNYCEALNWQEIDL